MTTLLFSQTVCSTLEALINKALALNTANIALNKLDQQTLTVKLAELNFPLSFSVNNEKFIVTTITERANCTITTSIKTLQELQAKQNLTDLIKQDKLDLEGDIQLAQQFSTIAEKIDIDWQSEFAKHIGDIPTHKLGQLSKNITKKLSFAATQIKLDASEYIVHEKKLVVTKNQITCFNQKVAHIFEETNLLEKRIQTLSKKL